MSSTKAKQTNLKVPTPPAEAVLRRMSFLEQKLDKNTELLRNILLTQELRQHAIMLCMTDIVLGRVVGISSKDEKTGETSDDIHWDHYVEKAKEQAATYRREQEDAQRKASEESSLAEEMAEAYGEGATFFGGDVEPREEMNVNANAEARESGDETG